jgi:hypothetical protein
MMANLLSAVPPCVSAYLFESERERNREREKETERERESERVCVGMYVCAPVLCRHGLVVGQGQEPRLDHTAETLLVGREKRGRSPRPRPRNATAVPSASRGAVAMRPSLIKPEMMRPMVVL